MLERSKRVLIPSQFSESKSSKSLEDVICEMSPEEIRERFLFPSASEFSMFTHHYSCILAKANMK